MGLVAFVDSEIENERKHAAGTRHVLRSCPEGDSQWWMTVENTCI